MQSLALLGQGCQPHRKGSMVWELALFVLSSIKTQMNTQQDADSWHSCAPHQSLCCQSCLCQWFQFGLGSLVLPRWDISMLAVLRTSQWPWNRMSRSPSKCTLWSAGWLGSPSSCRRMRLPTGTTACAPSTGWRIPRGAR